MDFVIVIEFRQMFDFYNNDSDFEVTCEKENFDS